MPVALVVKLPVQVKVPVVPSMVQPVLLEPPAILTVAAFWARLTVPEGELSKLKVEEPESKELPLTDRVLPTTVLPVVVRVLSWVFPKTFKEDSRFTPELTVKDEPIPTFPVKSEKPVTLKPPWSNSSPVVVSDPPTPTLPLVVSDEPEITPSIDEPETVNPDKSRTSELKVAVPPIPTFPEVFNPAREVSPKTLREDSRLVPLFTVRELPTPTLPVKSEKPFTLKPLCPKIRLDTFREEPIPVFPEVERVDSWELPETFNEESKFTPDVTVSDDPIPTLPEVFKVPVMPVLVKEVTPETFNDERLAADWVVSDPPTPTLPETFKDEPTPTKPEKKPLPATSNL